MSAGVSSRTDRMGGRRESGGGARPRPMPAPAPAPNRYPSHDARGSSHEKPASSMDMREASREKRGSVSHERRPPASSVPASPRRRLRPKNDALERFSGGGIAAAAPLLKVASFLSFCLRRHLCHFLLNTEAAQKLPAISFRSLGEAFLFSADSRSMWSLMALPPWAAALLSAATSPEMSIGTTAGPSSTTGTISSGSMTTGMSSSKKSSGMHGAASTASAAMAVDEEAGNARNAVPSRTRSRSSWWNSAHSVLRPRTSHECRCGSSALATSAAARASPPRPHENDLQRRRSGGCAGPDADELPAANGLANRDRMADVDLRPGAEAAAADASRPWRRSRRHAAQKPVNVSPGCRSQLVDTERRAGGAGGSMCSVVIGPRVISERKRDGVGICPDAQ
uniref:Uncharacterized protein n=1 Tax=Zea mays TaxID=4577 RepID=A0A804QXY1_MAIZE